jgi:S1-C subfamily serine protease
MSMTPDGDYQPEQPAHAQVPAGTDSVPTPDPAPRRRRPWIAIVVATAAVVCIGGLGTAVVGELTAGTSTSATSSTTTPRTHIFGNFGNGNGNANGNRFGGLQSGQSIGQQATAGSEATATAATAAQEVGLVTINTVLDYNTDSQAAGTGMILSSNGYILTNNHVVEDSTSISVTVVSTGQKYTATVVGTDKTADVAVLKLTGASGLTPVKFNASEKVTKGQAEYSVGNAEGTGSLVTAVGTVGAVNQSLTVGSDSSDASENLTGLIELNADVVSGDSGGALFDKSGDVIGMVTAASTGSQVVTGYALNIAEVLKVADQIQAGTASSDIVYGYPAFAGINIAQTATSTVAGVPVASTFPGYPAAKAGLAAGDTITAVNGTAVTSATQLSTAIQSYKVGATVTITYLDASGASQSASVTLVAGPAS